MKIAVFITIWTTQLTSADLRSHFLDRPLAFLQAVPEVVSIDLFAPEPGYVALVDESVAPVLMIQIDLSNASDAETLVQSDDFLQLILNKSAYAAQIDRLDVQVLETVHFSIPGQRKPPPRTAPLSFVVRYYGPTDDEATFARFYTENHPPILATFPGIRNVLCYLPLNWRSTGKVLDSSMILGNEVVFDDLESLNRALKSDVMLRLREDGKLFAAFGYNTHHVMRRERIFTHGKD